MSNRTFAAQPSLVKSSYEGERQALRQQMAKDISRSMGEAPDYGSNRMSDYLKLADKDLRYAANMAIRCSNQAFCGACATSAGALVSAGNALAFSFNQVSVAATVTAGLGVAAFVYAEYKSRQLKNGINAQIQHFDKA